MRNETAAEQIARKCVHFNGVQNASCKAGVVYATVESKEIRGFAGSPCFREGEGVPCEKRHFPTAEEVDARVAERKKSTERLFLGMGAASEDAKQKGYRKGNGGQSSLPCPVCKTGILHYSVAGYNGHMRGQCTTAKCLSWMQ